MEIFLYIAVMILIIVSIINTFTLLSLCEGLQESLRHGTLIGGGTISTRGAERAYEMMKKDSQKSED